MKCWEAWGVVLGILGCWSLKIAYFHEMASPDGDPSIQLFLVGLVALWVSGMLIGAENFGGRMP